MISLANCGKAPRDKALASMVLNGMTMVYPVYLSSSLTKLLLSIKQVSSVFCNG